MVNIQPLCFTLLFTSDTRPRDSYDESHISVARFAVKVNDEDFAVPSVGIEVPTLRHIIVYDSNTVSVVENSEFWTGSTHTCAHTHTEYMHLCTM